jgi:hypothetical protein
MKLYLHPITLLKIKYLCHLGDTEIGGYGIILEPNKSLYVENFHLVPQVCTSISVDYDDLGRADYLMDQADQGLKPHQCMRVSIHTHPGGSAQPSGTDEANWKNVYGPCDWAIMLILAKGGEMYARLKVKTLHGPAVEVLLDVVEDTAALADLQQADLDSLIDQWDEEYFLNVQIAEIFHEPNKKGKAPTDLLFCEPNSDLALSDAEWWAKYGQIEDNPLRKGELCMAEKGELDDDDDFGSYYTE